MSFFLRLVVFDNVFIIGFVHCVDNIRPVETCQLKLTGKCGYFVKKFAACFVQSLHCVRRNEPPAAGNAVTKSAPLQFGISLLKRVRIHGKLHRQCAHGCDGRIGFQLACEYFSLNTVYDLFINRCSREFINLQKSPPPFVLNQLPQLCY